MEIKEFVTSYIETTFGHLTISPAFNLVDEDDAILVQITGEDLSFLIGRRGETLESLQFLLSLAAFKEFGEWKEVRVDINNYRDKKRDKIEEIAKNYIDRVRFFSEEVHLPFMSSTERKFVHEFVNAYDDIESSSEGAGMQRHVVLRLVDNAMPMTE